MAFCAVGDGHAFTGMPVKFVSNLFAGNKDGTSACFDAGRLADGVSAGDHKLSIGSVEILSGFLGGGPRPEDATPVVLWV